MTSPGAGPDIRAAFLEHGSALLGFAVNATGDRALAEDCLQETFLRAWRARDQFDATRGSHRAWLFGIERRVIADQLKNRRRLPHPSGESPIEGVAPDDDPTTRLGLVEALATLSREHREAVVAVHLSGMSYAQYSATSGVPVATLRTRVFYALRAMRAHLEETERADD